MYFILGAVFLIVYTGMNLRMLRIFSILKKGCLMMPILRSDAGELQRQMVGLKWQIILQFIVILVLLVGWLLESLKLQE